ncbi:hypothetical protein CC85DRAFT_6079 [Cutaneotrichosporon oleaginosum]|uniref:RNA-dependent RNA polymerase n=1 Tax=Cutaneotrichosporon oleaginosum TaxID=879819 RepID=A0A0J0XZU3_9TREE|nr:uncharacterized protein CC85DRAFT_6079 [Cutaneotrichosporon oleaginosum]KLT46567.1 hypothetical protein CC85DRAFT_6079 [Cutaneotrichosporon oleaginosum]TXT15068.1 hypothetical protein COLE_01261 [Cutaneotrichosporon oleaginosum]
MNDITPGDIVQLKGPVMDAMHRIPAVVRSVCCRADPMGGDVPLGFSRRIAAWAEMDREESVIMDNSKTFDGVFNTSAEWPYGGRLVYALGIQYNKDRHRAGESLDALSSPFSFDLLPVTSPSTSTRLARRFGSRRILTLRCKNVPRRNGAREKLFTLFRGRALVLFGRVFRVMWIGPDSEKAIAIQTNEVPPCGTALAEPPMPSFLNIILGFNSLDAKRSQAMAKWASRIQLIQSDSVPAAIVDAAKIIVVRDLTCDGAGSQPGTTQILTDGCGLMSAALALRIKQHPSFTYLPALPSAIQMRLGGAKGVLVVMSPQEQNVYPGIDVVLRDSMVKSHPSARFEHDPSNFTLDILKVDGLRIGSTLSSEPAIVMAHNGVPQEVLVGKARRSIAEIGEAFAAAPHDDEDEVSATARLLLSVYRSGGVGTEQRKREVLRRGQSCKVAGLVSRQVDADDEMDDTDDGDDGKDLSPAEILYRIIRSGIQPTADEGGCVYAATQLRQLVSTLTLRAACEYRIPIEQSLSALMVPDTAGVLAPDEIFVAFGQEQPLNPLDCRRMTFLEGDCLAYRSPCKLPTDVRKFRAVVHPALLHLRDCIVFSAHTALCGQSPASFLGGGDYDGDVATVIWDPDIVEPFSNAPDHMAVEPPGFEKANFAKEIVTADQFLKALDGKEDSVIAANLQHFLLGHLLDEQLTGQYSEMHACAAYTRGVEHPETLRLARMFCQVLDSRKSGLSVLPAVKRQDMQKFSHKVAWRTEKMKAKGKDEYLNDDTWEAVRPHHLPPFIMDEISAQAQAARLEVLRDFPGPNFPGRKRELIPLAGMYKDASLMADKCPAIAEQLRLVERHVKWACDVFPLIFHWKNLDLIQHYADTVHRSVPSAASDGNLSRQSSTVSLATTASYASRDSGPGKGRRIPPSITRARLRELRRIWRDGLRPADVHDLVVYRHERTLAELKVSYAVYLSNAEGRSVVVPFHVDLETICNMAAEARGPTAAMPATTAALFRPRH